MRAHAHTTGQYRAAGALAGGPAAARRARAGREGLAPRTALGANPCSRVPAKHLQGLLQGN